MVGENSRVSITQNIITFTLLNESHLVSTPHKMFAFVAVCGWTFVLFAFHAIFGLFSSHLLLLLGVI
ncbi:hypothetical protein AQUCO_00500203v1 [Aquilegia coerulea]|uniref:Uncharacterized protein n=1 Tax=Aquilegia coerulea TaxID=218851 RepID=A0A2G5ER06_AQUCA|nr:hypothetical protein AQUCO_00500203v1 [Aquilegia coerulea]